MTGHSNCNRNSNSNSNVNSNSNGNSSNSNGNSNSNNCQFLRECVSTMRRAFLNIRLPLYGPPADAIFLCA